MGPAGEVGHISRWANRFIVAAVVQGPSSWARRPSSWTKGVFGTPAASRIVAAGGAGTGLIVGYVGYVTLGVLAVAATALFYHPIELDLGKPYGRLPALLAWVHLFLMNIGVTVSTWLMMNEGYRGGAASLPASVGGLGWNALQVHTDITQYYPPYIAGFMGSAWAAPRQVGSDMSSPG